ncbi:MAG: PilX N-terminal domain-containing pilus assembly protein, partial [Paraburkholderia graminis]|uniref:PilX N-terminal domain-containing pilus assembly protein n=1 Tax=Paraburkholderia graminis TaxID=60548 RepID=UPI003899CD27
MAERGCLDEAARQQSDRPRRLRRYPARMQERGTVLPIVLLISAMLLATSAAWFEASLAAARSAVNVRDYLQAFHAADSAL